MADAPALGAGAAKAACRFDPDLAYHTYDNCHGPGLPSTEMIRAPITRSVTRSPKLRIPVTKASTRDSRAAGYLPAPRGGSPVRSPRRSRPASSPRFAVWIRVNPRPASRRAPPLSSRSALTTRCCARLSLLLSGCGSSGGPSAAASTVSADDPAASGSAVAASNPLCDLFTIDEVQALPGTPVGPGEDAAMGTGCQWNGDSPSTRPTSRSRLSTIHLSTSNSRNATAWSWKAG